MHTDEYEISLAREINVCGKAICNIEKSLKKMEQKHSMTSAEFSKKYRNGKLPNDNKDFAKWFDTYEALERWKVRKREFEELFHRLKI